MHGHMNAKYRILY